MQAKASHQHRGIYNALEGVDFLRAQVEQVTRMQVDRISVMLERHVAFNALHGDFAGKPVPWDLLAGRNYEPDQFEAFRLHQRRGLGDTDRSTERQMEKRM